MYSFGKSKGYWRVGLEVVFFLEGGISKFELFFCLGWIRDSTIKPFVAARKVIRTYHFLNYEWNGLGWYESSIFGSYEFPRGAHVRTFAQIQT